LRGALLTLNELFVSETVVPGSAPSGPAEFVPYHLGVGAGGTYVAPDAVDVGALESNGHFICSVPLRNAGAGLAFITAEPLLDHPSRADDYIGAFTTQVGPPGEQTRAYFSPGTPLDGRVAKPFVLSYAAVGLAIV
jgi:hypothetical protein